MSNVIDPRLRQGYWTGLHLKCILCLSSSGPHYEANLLGGWICAACMDETLDCLNSIVRIHTTPYLSRYERKALIELSTKLEHKLIFDKTEKKMKEEQSYTPLSKEKLKTIKVGDVIERMLAFAVPMYLTVSKVENGIIETGPWTFSVETGLEIDEDIPTTVSYIRRILTEDQKQLIKDGAKSVPYPLIPIPDESFSCNINGECTPNKKP